MTIENVTPAENAMQVENTAPAENATQVENTAPAENAAQTENANAYQAIIEQQQEQINALLNQTKLLNDQITSMIQNGTQIRDVTQHTQQTQSALSNLNTQNLADQEYSLESLAREIGRKNH